MDKKKFPVLIIEDTAKYKKGTIIESYRKVDDGIEISTDFLKESKYILLTEALSKDDEKKIEEETENVGEKMIEKKVEKKVEKKRKEKASDPLPSDPVLLGRLLPLPDGSHAHANCLRWSSEVVERGGKLVNALQAKAR